MTDAPTNGSAPGHQTTQETDAIIAARAEGWQEAHEPREECGHPRDCWQDKNWPDSEKSYNPETRTSDPPIEYRCLMCELEGQLKAVMAVVSLTVAAWDAMTQAWKEMCEIEKVRRTVPQRKKGGRPKKQVQHG